MALSVWELARISELVYSTDNKKSFGGGLVKRNEFSTKSFYAAVFEKKGDIVLAFRGTDQPLDYLTGNITNFLAGVSLQSIDAIHAYRKAWQATAKTERQNFYITGHSLGGALTTIVTLIADDDVRGVTFCAPGVGVVVLAAGLPGTIIRMVASHIIANNLVNICVRGDVVSHIPGLTGKKIWVNAEYKDKHSIKELGKNIKKSKEMNVDVEKVIKEQDKIKKSIDKS